jgi:hypothetical protein
MGEINTCRTVVGKPKGKRTFERSRNRWENHITMDLKEIRCEGVDWILLAQERVQWRVLLAGDEPLGFIKVEEFVD